VRLAAEHPSAYGVYSAGDVNMKLRGLGILCEKAAHNTDSFHGEEHVLWFIGSTLTDLAALLEAGDATPKPNEYAVITAEQTDEGA
jgi:hypothetical protein